MTRYSAAIGATFIAASVAVGAQARPTVTHFSASGAQLGAAIERVDALLADGRLELGRSDEDTMLPGRVHERLVQRHHGLPVFGGEVVRQLTDSGRIAVSVFGRVYEGIDVDVRPQIEPEAALAVALAASEPEAAPARAPELGVLPLDRGGAVLAFRIDVRSPHDRRIMYVNARTSVIELQFSNFQSQATVGRGTGVFGDQKKLSVSQASAGFRADDRLRPAHVNTADFRGALARLNAFLISGSFAPSDVAVDADNVWTDGATVDAHVYQGWTLDYYFKRFGRRGIDDRNRMLRTIVHPLARADADRYSPQTRDTLINNALYLGDGLLLFGDGDGFVFDFFAAALDVVAHEITHGVTEFSSNLEYRNEPGALNEAFSDIMGAATEFFFEPAGTGRQRSEWLIAEDVTRLSPGYLRSMQNPVLGGQPDHYSLRFTGPQDNGGVHVNSGIVNHAFYLAVAGGTNRVSGQTVQGIGIANLERMERIFYRAFVFLLGPRSQFSDARAATLEAAGQLYGASSNEQRQLAAAWNAVGVN